MVTERPVSILDDPARMRSVDNRNMLRLINDLPEQYETALGIGRGFTLEPLAIKPSLVFLTGIGDSGITGDVVVAAVSDEISVPIVSDHGGRLPKYVGKDALVFVSDYSGRNPVTLRNYREAKQRGAAVICVTTGGPLHAAASIDGTKIIKIPAGQPARSAIGYLFVPIAVALERYGLAFGLSEKLSQAIKLVRNAREALRYEVASPQNEAKQLAQVLRGKLIVVYGASDYRSAVADRWKLQINANSKLAAISSLFPDAADGEISGWELADKQCKDFAFVFLKDSSDKAEVARLMNASADLLGKFQVVEVEVKGSTTLERLLYGLYLGDYVSCYLALLHEVNPTETRNVTYVETATAGATPVA